MLYDIEQRRLGLAKRMEDEAIEAGIFENGMEWFFRKNHRPDNKVLVCLIIKTGSAYEMAGNYGIAHFIEHMLFNGTKSYEGEALIEELQHLGVGFGHDLNAYTSLDHTVYHLEIERSPENVTKALHILSEFAYDARLEPKHIEKERPIILEEKRLRSGRGEKYIRLLLERLFPSNGYARLVIGTDEDISSVQKKDFDAFYKTWYAPQNMAIAVVGDVDGEVTKSEMKRLFDRKRAEALPMAPLVLEEHSQTESYNLFTHEESGTGGLHVFTTRKGLRSIIPEEDQLSWMRYVVAEVLSERCQTYVTDHVTPITQAQCEYVDEYTRQHDLFTAGCVFNPEHTTEAATFIATELERMRRYGPTRDEVNRVCSSLQNQLKINITERENTQHWPHMQKIMSSFLHEDCIGTPEEDLRLLLTYKEKTSLEELTEVARDILDTKHLVTILELPTAQAHEEMTLTVRSIMEKIQHEEITRPGDAEETEAEERFITERTVYHGETLPHPLDMTKLTLEGGAPCYIKQTDFQTNSFNLRIVFEGGDMYLPREHQGLTEALLKYMADSGTKRRSASKIHKILQSDAISIRLEEELPSSIALYASCDADKAPLLMELVHDILFDPQWSTVGWLHAQQHMALLLQEAMANPRALLVEAHTKALLHNHASAFIPRKEDMDLWTPQLLESLYNEVFHAGNMHVSIVSSMSVDNSSALVARYLSALPLRQKTDYQSLKIRVPFPAAVSNTLYGANEDKATIHHSIPGVPFLHPQEHLYTLTTDIFSDRLRKAVRENMGNTYSIGASHNGYICLKGGDITVRFSTAPKEGQRTLDRINEELHRMAESGVTQDELSRVLAPRRTRFQANLKDNNFWLHVFTDPWNGIPDTHLFNRYERLQSTTAEEISAFLKKDFQTTPRVTTTLLPKKVS